MRLLTAVRVVAAAVCSVPGAREEADIGEWQGYVDLLQSGIDIGG
ncbi:hypothetical protein [Hyphomicrobium sp.]